jgi:DNA helicase-2/ATP-dependent DNA helicase PcrA
LTPPQQQAVEYDAGPLIVLAGPGTGKTRTIIHRIAHQIQVRGIAPESIVALTFTVKAAAQLRDRLAGLVGSSMAERVNAATIHGFGHRLIRRFGDTLGLPPELELIDAAQSYRLLSQVILDHGLFESSRGQGLRGVVGHLRTIFEGLNHRGLTPKVCSAFTDEWGRRMERGAGLTEVELDAQRAEQAYFADAVLAFGIYTAERLKRGWITFEDLLNLPLRLLRERPTVLAICRDEYRAFIVDEFQDCNPAQIELLSLLCGDGKAAAERRATQGPDLCVVGDDDQAIYAFRGADEQAFRRFAAIWPPHEVMELDENFRSQPPVIAVGNAVIKRAQVRFRPDKTIAFPESKTPMPSGQAGVEAIRLEEDAQDGDVIASMILADRAQTALAGKARPWKHYAVIARTKNDLDRVGAALRLEGVPFERQREASPLDDPAVEDVLAWVEWLVNPDATWAARRVLLRPPLSIAAEEVTTWEREYKAQVSQAHAGRAGVGAPGRFADWLLARGREEPGVARAVELYQGLAKAAQSTRADELLFQIMTATDPVHAELLPARERSRRVASLVSLLTLARDKQRRLAPPGDLAEFWQYFQELRDADAGMPAVVGLKEAVDGPLETADPAAADDGAVQLLTAHVSKGLEFDTVFVTRVRPQHGFPSTKGEPHWETPEGLFDSMDSRTGTERRADEERRLFYVACTRAERRLVVLAKANKSPSKSTHYFEELTLQSPQLVTVRDAADVLREAGKVGALARTSLDGAGLDFRGRARIREAADRARRQARVEAAQALEMADRADLSQEQLAKAAAQMKAAAELLATAAAGERGVAIDWLLKQRPDLKPVADRLLLLHKAGTKEEAASAGELVLSPMEPPLRLSYTDINSYHRCPRCFYLSKVMGLPQPDSSQQTIGTTAHRVLKQFYDLWAKADSEGQPRPGLEQLLAMSKESFLGSLDTDEAVSAEALDQLAAQMRLLFSRLHDPNAHVLETERAFDFDYILDGVTHRFTAKLDRIDLLPSGGVRIIDYKTGHATKRLLEPSANDLQLGIYALALRHSKGSGWALDGTLDGVAEYWCLATGQRGTIQLTDIDEAEVREQIDEAARGMLKGQFPRKPDCSGPCRLFGD